MVENQFDQKIKILQPNGGMEFQDYRVHNIIHSSGLFCRISFPCTQAQNGQVERKHHHIIELGLAMLFHSHVSVHFWIDAFSTSVYTINYVPTKLLGGKSPFELFFGTLPNFSNFHPFGYRVFSCLKAYSKHKLSTRIIPCIFFGIQQSV